VQIILVGLKADMRDSGKPNLVTREEAEQLAVQIGATQYLECSAQSMLNVEHIFDEAIRTARGVYVRKPTRFARFLRL
jgi:GTPase SAR1 family protein